MEDKLTTPAEIPENVPPPELLILNNPPVDNRFVPVMDELHVNDDAIVVDTPLREIKTAPAETPPITNAFVVDVLSILLV